MADYKCIKCNLSWDITDEICSDCRHFNFFYDDFGECKISYNHRGITSFCDIMKKDKRFSTCPGCQMVYDHNRDIDGGSE